MGEKKSYLEQLREYCKDKGIEFSLHPSVSFIDGYFHIRFYPHNSVMLQYGDTPDEAAKKVLDWLNKHYAKESSTPHEDALRAWCKEMGYTFSDKHEAGCGNWFDFIWIKELDIMKHSYSKCRDVSYGTRESACKQVLINAKAAHEETERELEEFCRENQLTIEPWLDGEYRIFNDLECIIAPLSRETLDTLKAAKFHKNRGSMFEDREDIARRRLKKFCDEEGLTLSTTLAYRVQVVHQETSSVQYFENSRSALFVLKDAKEERTWIWGNKDKYKVELEEFCKEEGLRFVAMGTESIWDTFSSYQKEITRLKEMKANKEWKWEKGPYERKVRELCERKGWTLVNRKNGYADNYEPWIIDVEELAGVGVQSFKKGEEGFKEVWDNIQKLKELLS